ncbi:MAG: PQQ-binding-like beta-propeller repeat protein [Planctomycetota bacterium]
MPQCNADDWPRWMGITGDGVYGESGIVETIATEGLPIRWRAKIGGGYAGPAVVGDRVLVTDYQKTEGKSFNAPNSRANLKGKERCVCLDAKTGRVLWVDQYDCPYSISYPAGPRCTPTVDGDRVYTLGAEGNLRCLDLASGNLIWEVRFKEQYSAEVPIWGFSSHPLVHEDMVISMVGGDGQGVVAFDKQTGKQRWAALDAKAGYCPPTIIDRNGTDQLIVFHPGAVVGMNPSDGAAQWSIPISPEYEMSIARPQRDGDLLYVSGIRTESVMIRLGQSANKVTELWRGERNTSLFSGNATPVFHDGVLYGADLNDGSLMAVWAKDGSRLWKTFDATVPSATRRVAHGTCFVTRRKGSDRYLIFSERGDLILATLTRQGYQENGRMHVVDPIGEAFGRGVVWSHPAYANQTAYVRNDKEIVAVDIAKK